MDTIRLESSRNKSYRLRVRIGLIFIFALYVICYRYFYSVNPFFYWIFFLFVRPALFSFILSFFFIESTDDRQIVLHRKIRFSFFSSFLRISLIFWFFLTICLFLCSLMLNVNEQKDLYLDLISNFIVVLNYFWLAASIFEKNKICPAFKTALKTALKYPAFYTCFFIFSFLDTVVFKRLMLENGFLPVISFGFLFAVGYLIFYKMIILKFASHGNLSARQELLNGYLKQDETLEHDENKELNDGKKCLILGIFSFLPFVHLAALFYSFKRIKRQRFGRLRAVSGFVLGAFFTAMYLFAVLAAFMPLKKEGPSHIRTIQRYLLPGASPSSVQKALRQILNDEYFAAMDSLDKAGVEETEAVCFAKGIIYEDFKDYERSIAMFSKCSQLNSQNSEVYFHLGFLTMYKPDGIGQARSYFEKFLSFYPHDSQARGYLRLLDNSVDWPADISVKIIMIAVLLLSFILHEYSHALTAYKCGDESQKDKGRLTLNPFPHLDLFGSIILPAVLLLRNSPVIFGWARPVSIDKTKFKQPDRDEVLVSLMGPVMNLAVALAATLLLVLIGFILPRIFSGFISLNFFSPFGVTAISGVPFAKFWTYVNIFLLELVIMSLVLAVFNLLPIPPLDGSWLLPKYLPAQWQVRYEALRKYSFILILIIVLTPLLDIIIGLPLVLYLGFLNLVIAAPFGLG